jgi:regulator of sigma E protease
MLEILDNIRFVVLLILFFGASIFVHELGHFLAARWCGLVVEVFSIGFGPSIWKKTYKGIVYKIGCLPLGGYVALPQLDPTGMNQIQGDSTKLSEAEGTAPEQVKLLPHVSAWRKIVVSLAGPIGNIVFAVPLAWLVYAFGMPAGPAERSGIVGYVDPKGIAYEKGMRIGDEIVAVNKIDVESWTDVRLEAALRKEVTLHITSRDGVQRTITLATVKGTLGEQALPGIDGPSLCLVQSVTPGSTAHEAGMKPGDLVITFNGQVLYSWAQMIQLVQASEGRTVEAEVKRVVDGEPTRMALSVTPKMDPEHGKVLIGIMFNTAAVDFDTIVNPTPMEQLGSHATAIFRFLAALMTPGQSKAAAAAVGGPVAIFVSYWYIVKASLMLAIWFTGFLNVNLAILNLLPIPVLDGGHICFALIEMVRRKPMSPKIVNVLVNGFAVALIGLFIVLSVRDLDRFTPVGRYFKGLFNGEQIEAVGGAPSTNSVSASGQP